MVPWVEICRQCGQPGYVSYPLGVRMAGQLTPIAKVTAHGDHKITPVPTLVGVAIAIICPFVSIPEHICEECGNDVATVWLGGRWLCTDCAEEESP